MVKEVIVFLLLFFKYIYALFANDEALGWRVHFSLDDTRCLPTLKAIFFILELGSFGPHSGYVLEGGLEILQNPNFCSLLLSFNVFELFLQFMFGVVSLVLLYLTFLLL